VTSTEITVGNVATTGGPIPGLFAGAQVGAQAYLDYVNSTGGVSGRRLVLDNRDDALSCSQNTSQTLALVPSVIAFVGSFSLFDNCGGEAMPRTVPNVSVSLNPPVTKLPNAFAAQPIQNGWSTGPLLWIKQHYPSVIKHVGALVGNVPSVLNSWAGELHALNSLGFDVTTEVTYAPLDTQFTSDVIKMQQAGVQLVLLDQADVSAIAHFVDAMQLQGFHPTLITSSGAAYDGSFISKAGTSAASNVIVDLHESLYLGQDAKAVPGVALFDHWIGVAHPGYTPDIFSVYGWSSAMLFVQALRKAGADPTRASLIAQLKKITSFDAGGLVAPDDPASKQPPSCFLIAKVVNGTWQRVTPSKGFICSGTYLYDTAVP
jgi:ABC-type branched-subunit amino acid transport system substrate-binding protein